MTITTRFQESLQQAVRTLPTIIQPQQQSILHSARRQAKQIPTLNQQNQQQAPEFWVEDIVESQESPLQKGYIYEHRVQQMTLGSRRPEKLYISS